jgi:hypothetical protein
MTIEIIPLKIIHYEPFARDGTWCCTPYPGHPKGCPNFTKGCTRNRPNFVDVACGYKWFAVIETFDLKAHAEKMKKKHPGWSDRKCRNLLYWQGTVRANLRNTVALFPGDLLLDIPEACGINVFETMAEIGIILERKPDIVRKVMIYGRKA